MRAVRSKDLLMVVFIFMNINFGGKITTILENNSLMAGKNSLILGNSVF